MSTFSERDYIFAASVRAVDERGHCRASGNGAEPRQYLEVGFHSVWVLDEIRFAGEGANDRAPLPLCSTRFDSRLCDQESGVQ